MAITVTPANVRAAIDVSLTTDDLPDATINLAIYKDAAIAQVKQADPLWNTRTGDEAVALNNAADYYCAALVVFAVPSIKKETYAQNEGYERTPVDPWKLQPELLGRGDQYIAIAVAAGGTVSATVNMPTIFTTAPGCRGR